MPFRPLLCCFCCLVLLLVSRAPRLPAQGLAPPSSTGLSDLEAAQAAYSRGDWTGAVTLARATLRTRPEDADALYLLATALFHQGHAADSLNAFTLAAHRRPPTPVQLRIVALDYVLLNDYDDADRWISRSLAEDARDGESWYSLGRIRQTENRFADAIAAFRKSLALVPGSVKAEDNLGLALEGLNRPEEAIAAYRQALAWQANDPHPSAQPFLDLGILLTDRNQSAEALPLLQRAVALAPGDPRAHSSLGRLYTRLNDLPQAQKELEAAVAARPDDASLHFQLGQVYRREGLQAQSTVELSRAAALESRNRR